MQLDDTHTGAGTAPTTNHDAGYALPPAVSGGGDGKIDSDKLDATATMVVNINGQRVQFTNTNGAVTVAGATDTVGDSLSTVAGKLQHTHFTPRLRYLFNCFINNSRSFLSGFLCS